MLAIITAQIFESAGTILMVAVGFGLVIFVHELGHFLLAKRIGAKVETFSLGFGPKVFGFTWGGTEYRLSMIPLGGYVKIKGQGVSAEKSESADDFEKKPVGKRMQVIVAGVVMNFLFTFPLCIAVLLIGRPVPNSEVTDVQAGSPAFIAGVQAGDKIISVVQSGKTSVEAISEEEWQGGKVANWQRIQRITMLGDESKSIFLRVERAGVKEPLEMRIPPVSETDVMRRVAHIGMQGGKFNVVVKALPKGSVQSDESVPGGKLAPGDVIKSVRGVPIEDPGLLNDLIFDSYEGASAEAAVLWPGDKSAKPRSKPVDMLIQSDKNENPVTKSIVTRVKGYYDAGIELYNKPVVGSVRAYSSAWQAGIRRDDVIVEIGWDMGLSGVFFAPRVTRRVERWQDVEDALGELINPRREKAGMESPKTVVVTVRRGGENVSIEVTPEKPRELLEALAAAGIYDSYSFAGDMLGIAAKAGLYVWRVSPESPMIRGYAGRLGPGALIAKGDRVLAIDVLDLSDDKSVITPRDVQTNMSVLFQVPPPEGAKAKEMFIVVYQKPGEEKDGRFHQAGVWHPPIAYRSWLEIGTEAAPDESSMAYDQEGLGGALVNGALMPFDIVALTYQSIAKMVEGKVSADQLSGPVGILQMSYKFAEIGVSTFLWFLAVISVNLAVLNILPIPVLDGGHMAFLVAEKVRGKPVSEKTRTRLEMMGLVLLLGLVVFATWNDIFSRILGQ